MKDEPLKNDIASYIAAVGRNARESSRIIGSATSASKSEALKQIAAAVDGARAAIREENAKDMAAAEHNGIDQPDNKSNNRCNRKRFLHHFWKQRGCLSWF